MSANRLRTLVVSVTVVLALLIPGMSTRTAVAAPPPAPKPLTPAQIVGPYPSDVPATGTFLPLLDGFNGLRAHRPDVIAENLATVVRINNSATPAQRTDAVEINYDDRIESLSVALGSDLGAVFRRLMAAGKLPKVATLVKGDLARAGLPMQTTLLEKQLYNNPRPFTVAPSKIRRSDRPGGHLYAELRGNGSYPSGHANMGYWKGALLAYWLPELGPQIIARAGEIGRSRVVLGVHYPLDVMGGRLMAMNIVAARLTDPAFAAVIRDAGRQLRTELERAVGMPLSRFIARDRAYLSTAQALADHRRLMTYGLPRIAPTQRNAIPVSAAALLRSRFPGLSEAQRLAILTRTAIPAGYPLDQAGTHGGWVRIDLAAALAYGGQG